MSCNWTVVVDPSAISRQSVGDRLGSDRQPIGDRSATGWRLYLERLFLIAETLQLFGDRSATDRRLVGDQSATKNCVRIVCNRCDWLAISRQPVGDLSATTKNLSTIDLVPERFHLHQPKPPCDQIVPATSCNVDLLATTLQPPCDHPKFWSQGGRRPVASYVWPGFKSRSYMYCNLSATALRLKNSCNQCNHCAIINCVFRLQINLRPVGDNYPRKSATSRRSVGDWWAIDCQLIGNRLRLVGNWLATGRRQVGDELVTDYRTNNLLCRCNHE